MLAREIEKCVALGLQRGDDDARQALFALEPHHVAGIKLDVEHIDALTIRDQVAPVGTVRGRERRGDDLEVDRIVGIGQDEEFVAAIGDRILHAFLACRDQPRRRIGIGKIDQPLLRCLVVAAGDHAEAAAGALVQMGEPAGILLLIDQDVVGLPGTELVPPHLHRAVVVVELDIEEAFGIRGPDHAAVGLFDEVVEIVTGCPVADADREILGALGVGAPGVQPVIVGMSAAAELEIFVVLRQRVAIEHDMRLAAIAQCAGEQLVLAALAEFSEIGERAVR